MSGAPFEATLDLWSVSLREAKRRMRPLFAQGRSAENAGLYLDGLLGDERRKTGWMRAEAAGEPKPVKEAACWVHARRPFFAMADLEQSARLKAAGKQDVAISPIAVEIVRRIDALFTIERDINGQNAEHRRAVRQELSAPLAADLNAYMLAQRARLSRGHDLAKAMTYILKRWDAFTLFLADGRVCLSNNAAERALRGIALGRKSWLFCGSDRGGQRAAAMYSLIITCKLNDIDAQAWLADVLASIAGYPSHRLADLLPWNWKKMHTHTIHQKVA